MKVKTCGLLAALTICSSILINFQDKNQKGEGPKVGENAPDFKLKVLTNSKTEIKLSSFKDKKPVVLIFGSYT